MLILQAYKGYGATSTGSVFRSLIRLVQKSLRLSERSGDEENHPAEIHGRV